MKTNNHFLKIISSVTNIIWYLNMAYIAVMFAIIVFFMKDHVAPIEFTAVKYNIAYHSVELKPIESQASSVSTYPTEFAIYARLRLTSTLIITYLLFVVFFGTLSTGILYHLRKIFAAVKQKQPFRDGVVANFKIIALLLALITPMHILYNVASYFILTHSIVDFNKQFTMVWSENFIGPILGAVIYIIADILKYGIELKKETEEFV